MSLRQGRFKKHSIPEEKLNLIGLKLYPEILSLKEKYLGKEIGPAEFCAHYIILFVKQTRGNLWLGAKRNKSNTMRNSDSEVLNLFENYTLRGIPEVVNETILMWHQKIIPLNLLFHIPKPLDVLREQMKGERSVTMITSELGLTKYVLEERDPLSFLIHDLQHAYKFFSHHESYRGQIGFYNFIFDLAKDEQLLKMMNADEQFKNEFEYAISDMNAYSLHLIKHLNNSFKEANKRLEIRQCLWRNYYLSKIKEEKTKIAFEELYTSNHLPDHLSPLIQDFFLDYCSLQ
jgi:hypothetical protein